MLVKLDNPVRSCFFRISLPLLTFLPFIYFIPLAAHVVFSSIFQFSDRFSGRVVWFFPFVVGLETWWSSTLENTVVSTPGFLNILSRRKVKTYEISPILFITLVEFDFVENGYISCVISTTSGWFYFSRTKLVKHEGNNLCVDLWNMGFFVMQNENW